MKELMAKYVVLYAKKLLIDSLSQVRLQTVIMIIPRPYFSFLSLQIQTGLCSFCAPEQEDWESI